VSKRKKEKEKEKENKKKINNERLSQEKKEKKLNCTNQGGYHKDRKQWKKKGKAFIQSQTIHPSIQIGTLLGTGVHWDPQNRVVSSR
jgi:hypothetical protein